MAVVARSRRSPLVRLVLLAVAAASVWGAWEIVFVDRIGRVVAILSRGHGIHAGDVLAVPLALVAIAAAAAALAPNSRRRHPEPLPVRVRR